MTRRPAEADPRILALQLRLRAQQEAGLWRTRQILDSAQGVRVWRGGREYRVFCSNDYLGLANDPRLAEALAEGARRWGTGSGASHLVVGHSQAHEALEAELAQATGRTRALSFCTGYLANLAVIATLVGYGDRIFQDRLNHASLLDGARLAGARSQRYRHRNAGHLERLLASDAEGTTLIVTDGVFSMDGDLADLPDLVSLAAQREAWLMVDDAHGFGVLGAKGGGICEHYGQDETQVPILVGTLGKACGTAGAFVAGSEALIEALIQFGRPYIYTTAQPPALCWATLRSLEVQREEPWRRSHLGQLVAHFRQGAQQLGLPLMESLTPIQPLLVGEAQQALALAAALERKGFWVSAIRPPTVPRGESRLRVTLSAAHTCADVESLLTALAEVWQEVVCD